MLFRSDTVPICYCSDLLLIRSAWLVSGLREYLQALFRFRFVWFMSLIDNVANAAVAAAAAADAVVTAVLLSFDHSPGFASRETASTSVEMPRFESIVAMADFSV